MFQNVPKCIQNVPNCSKCIQMCHHNFMSSPLTMCYLIRFPPFFNHVSVQFLYLVSTVVVDLIRLPPRNSPKLRWGCADNAEGKWRLQDEGLAKLFGKLVELVGRNMDVPWGKLTSSNSDAENTCFPQENNLQMKCLHG